jgi:protoheme IX farnesyltransferase
MTGISAVDHVPRANSRVTTHSVNEALARDYFDLMKPRVMSLVVFTALVGLVVAPAHVHPVIGFTALLCIAVGAGAAGALNMWFDADIDALMMRTARRPIPRGRIQPTDALRFGLTLAVGAVIVLGLLVNFLAAALLAFTIFFYVVVYTMWLKRLTPHNIVIGGVAGAFPPVIGWVAATGSIGMEPMLLFVIIFLWTPPHFWALSLFRFDDYARAGVPMLPVVSGKGKTRRQILIYSLLLAPTAVLPWPLGFAGATYGVVAVATGAVMVLLALQVLMAGDVGERPARRLFAFSILYLFMLFAVLLVEQGLRVLPANVQIGWHQQSDVAAVATVSRLTETGSLRPRRLASMSMLIDVFTAVRERSG